MHEIYCFMKWTKSMLDTKVYKISKFSRYVCLYAIGTDDMDELKKGMNELNPYECNYFINN